MARKTISEKTDEMEKLVAILNDRVDKINAEMVEITTLRSKVTVIEERLGDNDLRSLLAVLQERVGEMKRSTEETGRMRWNLISIIVGVVIGAVLTGMVQILVYFVQKL